MNTTLNEIKAHYPCTSGWEILLKSLGKTKADDDPVSLEYILKSNGIKDAVWCLRCFDYKVYCLFLADIAESVLPIYEEEYPGNNAPRVAIESIRLFESGEITSSELMDAAYAADAAAYDAAYAAAYAADAAYAAYAAAAYAADAAAYAAAYAAADADADADADAAYAAYAAATDAADAEEKKRKEIEELFIKYFIR